MALYIVKTDRGREGEQQRHQLAQKVFHEQRLGVGANFVRRQRLALQLHEQTQRRLRQRRAPVGGRVLIAADSHCVRSAKCDTHAYRLESERLSVAVNSDNCSASVRGARRSAHANS